MMLTGCSTVSAQENTSPESFVDQYFHQVKNNPKNIIGENTDIFKRYNILPQDSADEYFCQALKYNIRTADYTITDILDTDNGIQVNMLISAKKMGDILTSDSFFSSYFAKTDIMSENFEKQEDYHSAVIGLFQQYLHETKPDKTETPATLTLSYQNHQWKIIDSDNFVNALSGDIHEYETDINQKYGDFPVYLMDTSLSETNQDIFIEDTTFQTPQISADEEKHTEDNSSYTESNAISATEQHEEHHDNMTEQETESETYPPLIYLVDDEETFRDELIPNDTKSKKLPEKNKTTRTSRKKPVKAGDAGYYDNLDYFASSGRFSAYIRIDEIYRGQEAKHILDENQEKYDLKENEGIMLLKIRIVMDENLTDKNTVQIPYYDFDLINYHDVMQPVVKLKHLPVFEGIDSGEQTEGYLCFKYTLGENVNLAFKTGADNTLWFQVIK